MHTLSLAQSTRIFAQAAWRCWCAIPTPLCFEACSVTARMLKPDRGQQPQLACKWCHNTQHTACFQPASCPQAACHHTYSTAQMQAVQSTGRWGQNCGLGRSMAGHMETRLELGHVTLPSLSAPAARQESKKRWPSCRAPGTGNWPQLPASLPAGSDDTGLGSWRPSGAMCSTATHGHMLPITKEREGFMARGAERPKQTHRLAQLPSVA